MLTASRITDKLTDKYKLKNLRAMDKVSEGHYELSLKVIQKYYRQVTGKKESLTFYVDYIQPLKKHIKECEGNAQPDTGSGLHLADVIKSAATACPDCGSTNFMFTIKPLHSVCFNCGVERQAVL